MSREQTSVATRYPSELVTKYPEDIAIEIAMCVAHVDGEYSTIFKQFNLVGCEIDVQLYTGQWFRIAIQERVKSKK
jgi:hypothetical protein